MNKMCPFLSIKYNLVKKCKEKQCTNWDSNKNCCSFSENTLIRIISQLDDIEKNIKKESRA